MVAILPSSLSMVIFFSFISITPLSSLWFVAFISPFIQIISPSFALTTAYFKAFHFKLCWLASIIVLGCVLCAFISVVTAVVSPAVKPALSYNVAVKV